MWRANRSRAVRVAALKHGAAWLLAISPASLEAGPDAGLAFLEERVRSDPLDFLAWNQLSARYLVRLRETGDDEWLARATHAAAQSLMAVGDTMNPGGLAARSRANLAAHRFAEARDEAERLRTIRPGEAPALTILADASLDLGDLDAAARVVAELADKPGAAFEAESRLARLDLARGKIEGARAHYLSAEAAARAAVPPSPINVAWCKLQLGEIAFRTGDWEAAERDYHAALELQPGWWSAREHLAELRGAQGRTGEAFGIYGDIVAKIPRPELLQAIGDLHLFLGAKDEAKAWHDRAVEAYRKAADAGSVAYFHHLSGFYCDSEPNPAEALAAARKDLEQRHSAPALDGLAWALYKNGEAAAAARTIGDALATGIKDAHILYHAGLIRMSAGDLPAGQAAIQEAAALNPHFQSFHVHR